MTRDEQFAGNGFLAGAHGEILERQSFREREQLRRPIYIPAAVRRLPWRKFDAVRRQDFRPRAIGACLRPGSAAQGENDGVRRYGELVAACLEMGAPVVFLS